MSSYTLQPRVSQPRSYQHSPSLPAQRHTSEQSTSPPFTPIIQSQCTPSSCHSCQCTLHDVKHLRCTYCLESKDASIQCHHHSNRHVSDRETLPSKLAHSASSSRSQPSDSSWLVSNLSFPQSLHITSDCLERADEYEPPPPKPSKTRVFTFIQPGTASEAGLSESKRSRHASLIACSRLKVNIEQCWQESTPQPQCFPRNADSGSKVKHFFI
jgi:hypothetical protein